MKSYALSGLNLIAQAIFDKKGFNILALDVRGISTLTDFFLIAEGTVDRHVQALARAAIERMEDFGDDPHHVEGLKDGDWVVVDFGDVVVHLFTPEFRERYALEQVWREGKIIDVQLKV